MVNFDSQGESHNAEIERAIIIVRDRAAHSPAVVNRAWEFIEAAALAPAMATAGFGNHADDAKQAARSRAIRALRNYNPALVKAGPGGLPAAAAIMGARHELVRQAHQRRRRSETRIDEGIEPHSQESAQEQRVVDAVDMLEAIMPVLTKHVPKNHLECFLACSQGASYRQCAARFRTTVKGVDHRIERARWKIADLRLAAGITPADTWDEQTEKILAADVGGVYG